MTNSDHASTLFYFLLREKGSPYMDPPMGPATLLRTEHIILDVTYVIVSRL